MRRLPTRFVLRTLALFVIAGSAAASAATITVTGTGDTIAVDGVVTLREAIASVNAGSNVNADVVAAGPYGSSDAIAFAIPGTGVHTIQPLSQLAATAPVTIDGYTQPGASPNTLATGDDAVLKIEIDGSLASGIAGGVLQVSGAGSVVRGLVINRAQGGNSAALQALNGAGIVFAGNFIGTDPTGTIPRNNQCNGIRVDVSPGATIGGPAAADRNLASATSGCGINVVIENATNVQVSNNYIGTNASGTAALGGIGIYVGSSTGTQIGGSAATANLVSGNGGAGIILTNGNGTTVVQNNRIGTNAAGTGPLSNSSGIQIVGASQDATIAFNTIAYNVGAGIALPTAGLHNRILSNKIYSNGALGIDLGPAGPTPNDPGDADTGPNNLQNFPVITAAVVHGSSIRVTGTLSSDQPAATMLLEFFWNPACDGSGFGQGTNSLGTVALPTDGSGNLSFDLTLPGIVPAGAAVTATATDPSGNTSEFSACFTATRAALSFHSLTPCRLLDTRNPNGPYGGPALSANSERTFVATGLCGVPASVDAVAVNVAVTLSSAGGDLRLFPAGYALPLVSAINYNAGKTRSNNAVVELGLSDSFTIHADQPSGSVHVIVDVVGYFQ